MIDSSIQWIGWHCSLCNSSKLLTIIKEIVRCLVKLKWAVISPLSVLIDLVLFVSHLWFWNSIVDYLAILSLVVPILFECLLCLKHDVLVKAFMAFSSIIVIIILFTQFALILVVILIVLFRLYHNLSLIQWTLLWIPSSVWRDVCAYLCEDI
jgi:hypothetical protein